MRAALVSLALAALGTAAAVADQAVPAPADLARQVQAHFDTVHDFKADFTQQARSLFFKQTQQASGHVRVKKPGRMWWTYASPAKEKKEVVADGSQVYEYFPATRQGRVAPLPKGNDASAAVLFLIGRGDLTRDFTAAMPADQPAGEWHLTLTPRRPQSDFTSLTLVVLRRTFSLRGLEKIDDQGGTTTFQFTNLKENVGLLDKDFIFKFPPGTEIDR